MDFRTEIHVSPAPLRLSLQAKILTVGSCFSDVIGNRLRENKVETLVNPFGTIFNPVAAVRLLQAAAGEALDVEAGLVERQGMWYSLDLHSSFAAPAKAALQEKIQQAVAQVQAFLQQADLLILTFGTALVYRHLATDHLVANCHKLPAKHFERELLAAEEITGAVRELHHRLRQFNPKLRLLLTVSPVRHIKETLVLNSVSKATLRLACHQLTELLEDVQYFPSYELLLDDLRDYRFYGPDMIHPTPVAEQYIWEKFTQAWFDDAFQKFLPEWEKVRKALAHKPFQPDTEAHHKFLQNLLHKLRDLHRQTDCSAEIERVEAWLKG